MISRKARHGAAATAAAGHSHEHSIGAPGAWRLAAARSDHMQLRSTATGEAEGRARTWVAQSLTMTPLRAAKCAPSTRSDNCDRCQRCSRPCSALDWVARASRRPGASAAR